MAEPEGDAIPAPASLEELGLRPGEAVRWRRRPSGRWQDGTAVAVERDGSLSLRDDKGASRAIPVDLVEVTVAPRRRGGRPGWEPLVVRAARTEQLQLQTDTPAERPGRGRRKGRSAT